MGGLWGGAGVGFPAGPVLVWRLQDYMQSPGVTLSFPLPALVTLQQLSLGSWGFLPQARPPLQQGEICRGLSFYHLLFRTQQVPPGIFGHLVGCMWPENH